MTITEIAPSVTPAESAPLKPSEVLSLTLWGLDQWGWVQGVYSRGDAVCLVEGIHRSLGNPPVPAGATRERPPEYVETCHEFAAWLVDQNPFGFIRKWEHESYLKNGGWSDNTLMDEGMIIRFNDEMWIDERMVRHALKGAIEKLRKEGK